MMNTILLITGFPWLVCATSAELCPNPALLHPTSINTQAIVSAEMIEGIDLYVCSISKTYLKYECKESKLGNILDTIRDISSIRSRYFQGDTINFLFEYDTKTYTIKLNETEKSYIHTLTGDSIPNNGSCVGKLDKNQTVIEILNVTINMRASYLRKETYLLPEVLLKQPIVRNCLYTDGYCYDDSTHEHIFWKTATEVAPLKNLHAYAIFDNVHVYTMTKAPLLKYLLLKQNDSHVAIELVKESSYFPNSSLTHWQTDHHVNVSFHHYFKASFSIQTTYKEIELKISGSRGEAFNRMRTRCGLQRLEQNFTEVHDTLTEYDYYFPIFVIYMAWSFAYAMFNVMVNYCTLRRLRDRRINMLICAVSHATTNRYLYKHQHEEQDGLNFVLATINTKMETRLEHLERLIQMLETANRRKTTNDTYDYIRASKLKDMSAECAIAESRISSRSIGDKSLAESDKMPAEYVDPDGIKTLDEYITLIHDETNPVLS